MEPILTEILKYVKKIDDVYTDLKLHRQETKFELQKLHEQDQRQNDLIDEHIKGVRTLENILSLQKQEYEARFKTLEQPRVYLSTTKKLVLGVGALAGAMWAVIRFWNELLALFQG